VIEELYRLPRNAFTRERNARATALTKAGEPAAAAAVSRLRRPSAALWATNQLAHAEPERLAAFMDAVDRVRRAQLRDPRGAAGALQRQRAELDALVKRAAELLAGQGHRAAPASERRISDTLLGAAVNPQHTRELRDGRLTEELQAPGFEVLAGVPPGGQLRLLPGGKPRGDDEARSRRDAEQRARLEHERERRRQEADRLEREAAERRSAAAAARRQVEELAQQLRAARQQLRDAQRSARGAAVEREQSRGSRRPKPATSRVRK
jgi:hypothetical protein